MRHEGIQRKACLRAVGAFQVTAVKAKFSRRATPAFSISLVSATFAIACSGALASHATLSGNTILATSGVASGWAAGLFQDQEAKSTAADQQADNLAQIAANAQNAKDFEMAFESWERLCREYPTSKHRAKAELNAGICAAQLKKFDVAIPHFEVALKSLPAEESEGRATGHLFLGFSQLEHGRKMLAAGQSEAGRQLLTTATQVLANQLEQYPKYADNDQAAYFQGLAFEQLGRLPEAAQSFARMSEFPKQAFRFPGLFALANVNEQLGKFELALKHYQEYLAAAAKEATPPAELTEVRLRTAETLWQLALGAQNKGDQQEAQRLTVDSLRELEFVLQDQGFASRDEALFRFGLIQSQLGDHPAAAKAFFEVASQPNSTRAPQATLFTGRELLAAKSYAEADKWFTAAVESKGKYSAEAAHWLVQTRLQGGQPAEAYAAAEALLPTVAGSPWEAELLADRAEAAWQQQADPELRKRAPELYLAAAAKGAGNRLGESALYNAAFAQLELRELNEAIKLCTRYQQDFPRGEFLPDVLEVHADALLGQEQLELASQLLERLVKDFPTNPKHPAWQVRQGLTRFLAGDYETAAKTLAELAPTLGDKQLAAEAWHWTGASRLQLRQLEQAVAALEQSRAASGAWRRAPETLSLLAQAQTAKGDTAAAETTLAELKRQFPEHQSAADAELRLAKQAFAAGEYALALQRYEQLLPLASADLKPHALYDSGWCLAKLAPGESAAADRAARLSAARSRFSQVLADYPRHELAPLALLGTAAVERQAGDSAAALAALDRFLETQANHARALDARYERGLILGDLKRWPEAVVVWQELALLPEAKEIADRVHYELAWAHRENGSADAANAEFERLAKDFAQSPLAADACFQLGEREYAAGKFAEATNWYEKSLASRPTASLGERALYKLGFAQFRTKDYTRSLATFQQQVKEYPQGELHADGMFMVGESLFEAKQYDSALTAYRAFKPLLETSSRIKPENRWLTLLHAAQAANKQRDYQGALELARELADDPSADPGLKLDAALEMGNAHQQLGQMEPAVEAWTRASASVDKTGARATCMLGEALFGQKKFEEAARQFKQVIYGFGGEAEDAEIDPWQAFAAYELARSQFVQVGSAATPQLKEKLIEESIKWFEYLLAKYPNDRLAGDARKELDKLKQLQAQASK